MLIDVNHNVFHNVVSNGLILIISLIGVATHAA